MLTWPCQVNIPETFYLFPPFLEERWQLCLCGKKAAHFRQDDFAVLFREPMIKLLIDD